MGDTTHTEPFVLTDAIDAPAVQDRLRQAVIRYHRDVWRMVRNLGVPSSDLDDAVQQVFIVLMQRLDDVQPEHERAFLYGTAVRIAYRARRTHTRRREILVPDPAATFTARHLPADAIEDAEQRALLNAALDGLPDDLRAVLVMFEIQQLSVAEIAEALGLRLGTAATRLRRAREIFVARARRIVAQHKGGRR
jgi:RNA polymerase sigma-70 factor (ECF subfamily)